ncbi:MAG: hypothetical protein NTY01_10140 [Verrucomicrobia bacterium]|nr:hypothetical protein [Verrucomicrobiota bacterium]
MDDTAETLALQQNKTDRMAEILPAPIAGEDANAVSFKENSDGQLHGVPALTPTGSTFRDTRQSAFR